jgi:hypothetical protein
MLRKSLILGSITLLMVVLFALTGGEGPVGPAGTAGVDGKNAQDGPRGDDYLPSGPSLASSDVLDVDLDAAFKALNGNIVILKTSVGTVYGEVPAGKTLYVLGPDTKIPSGKKLIIKGTLDISEEAAVLSASAIPDNTGTLVIEGEGKVQGKGAIILPYVFDGNYTGLNYKSVEVAAFGDRRYPGSAFRLPGDAPRKLQSKDIADIFDLENLDQLTVQDVDNLETLAIPSHKSLILKGRDNVISSDFGLAGYSSLTVAEKAVLRIVGVGAGTGVELSTGVQGIITNNGTIVLEAPSSKIVAGASFFINNGMIESPTDTKLIIEGLISLDGTGTIRLNRDVVTLGVGGPTQLDAIHLRQNLIIDPQYPEGNTNTYTLILAPAQKPLGGVSYGKIITLNKANAVLTLEDEPLGVGAKVVNTKGGRIRTETDDTEVLATIFSEMGNRGIVEAYAELVDLKKDFEIPEGVTLRLSTNVATDLASEMGAEGAPFDVIVNGALILDAAINLAPSNDIIVRGDLQLGIGSLTTSDGNIDIEGTLNAGRGDGVVITGSGILSLPSVGVTGINGGTPGSSAKIQVPFNQIAIDSVGGYGAPDGLLKSEYFEAAVRDLRLAASVLRSTTTLSSTYGSVEGVGFADLSASGGPQPVIFTPADANNSATYVVLPDNIGVYSAGGVDEKSFHLAGSSLGNFNHNDFFVLADSGGGSNLLSINQTAFSSSGGAGSFAAEFNEVRFTRNYLIGSIVPTFWVGVTGKK